MGKPQPPVPKIGRPARGEGAATQIVGIRVTADEHAAWLKAAGDDSLSDWARTALNAAAKRRNERR
jgi:hypothetical protein